MIINKFSKIGEYHKNSNGENQDYICSAEGKDYIAVMLADGATSCKKSKIGAKLACEAALNIIEREGHLFFHYPEEKIACLLTEHILYFLEYFKEKEYPLEEYGSTFSMAFMDKRTGRTVLINLGDGAILLINRNGEVSWLLKQKRFFGNPCLTTTKKAFKAVDIKILDIVYGERLLLCSDGFLDQFKNEKVFSATAHFDPKILNDELNNKTNMDDCSYISFER